MEWLGDLERTFATNLYPLRVPIAIGFALAILGLALVARRRGWIAAVRRHRGRTIALVLAVLVVGLPIGWYLGSPLFIRVAVVEPAPSSGPAETNQPVQTGSVPTLAPIRQGTFSGADDFHFGRGTAQLIETEPGVWVVRFEDFSVRNGPDLYVYLSPDTTGYADGVVELGTLKATDGAFNMPVPAGTDVSAHHSVVIWCRQFAVQFAVAPLS